MSYNLNDDGEHRDTCEEGRDEQLVRENQYDADADKRAQEYAKTMIETRNELIMISKYCWDSVRKIDNLITKLES